MISALLVPSQDSTSLPNAADEAPDLVVVDARFSNAGLEQLRSLAASGPGRVPAALVIGDKPPENWNSDFPMDFIAASLPPEEITARIQWQLRFADLKREKERLEERLEEARRRASVGAIADGVAHNLNNVLGVIFGYMHLIKNNHRKPEVVLKHHASLQTAVDKITDMVRRFGAVARESESDPAPASAAALLSRSVERFRHEAGVAREYPFTLNPADLSVNTRFNSVEESLVEVLKNAWESYGDLPESEREIEISAESVDDENLFIRIRDRGCGIDPAIESTMFEPFSGTRNHDGLGLTLARRCFRNLDGDLILSAHPEGGTVAEIRHPLH